MSPSPAAFEDAVRLALTSLPEPSRFTANTKQEAPVVAFEKPNHVTTGLTMSASAIAAVGQGLILGGLQAAVAHRAAQADAAALDAWDRELRRARGDAAALGDLAKSAVVAMLDAEDEAAALRAEVAALRRAVAERDAAIRALAQ